MTAQSTMADNIPPPVVPEQPPPAVLAPPRPFFLAGSGRRASSSYSDAYDRDATRAPPSSYTFQDPLQSRRASLESLPNGTLVYPYAYPDGLLRTVSLGDLHRSQPQQNMESAGSPLTSSASNISLYRMSAAARISSSPVPHSPSPTFRPAFLSPASRPSSVWSWNPPDPAMAASSTALHANGSRSNLQLHRPPLPSTLLKRDGEKLGFEESSEDDPQREKEASEERERQRAKEREDDRSRTRAAWWITFTCLLAGAAASAILCWTGIRDVHEKMLDESSLCLVMNEDFSGDSLNSQYWTREVEVGGFQGQNEFQLNTDSASNVYLQDGQLYIMPTLTGDVVPDFDSDGKTYTLDGCTASVPPPPPPPPANTTTSTSGGNATSTAAGAAGTGATNNTNTGTGNDNAGITRRAPAPQNNSTTANAAGNACVAVTNYALGTVINPVMSGRITTKGKVGVGYGRVEIKAKLGRGDWLWPALRLYPENNTYGAWPMSGEIDILQARGNAPSYPAQGINYVRSSLIYGLSQTLVPITVPGSSQPAPLTKEIFGWYGLKRSAFDNAFHTYTVEWDERFVRFWVDSRVRSVLDLTVGGKQGSFWTRGKLVRDPAPALCPFTWNLADK
ncbi:hypothetical protein H0H81_005434 [Sphagnurus paluster]|uniref:GH16 domain-containing protein n=1 Tax=Sphagnurus paluster TaxID=117069 RepID=A0A9P7KM87_9AGAR|nr:hypothetical protein H0H81_005434 [Sphagnurus paluster]